MATRPVAILITADARGAIGQIAATSKAIGGLEHQGRSTAQNLARTGRSLTYGLTLPIVGAGIAAVKLATDFNTSMTHVQALVGASQKQVDAWSKDILALAPEVGKSPKELADALYFITSSGISASHALEVLKASAKAATSGLGDTQTIADLVTSAMNAYGAKTLSAANATDILTAAVRLGKGEPADLAQSLGRVIPVAQAMGVSFGEVSGAVAALTTAGLDADTATTGLRQVLLNLLKPSSGAATALESVGLSVKGIQDVVRNQGLIPALELLNKKFDGNRSRLAEVITNARSLTAAFQLIGPNGKKAADIIDQVTHSSGESAKAFNVAAESAQVKFNKSLADLQAQGIKTGAVLLPIATKIVQAVGDIAVEFGKLPEPAQNATLALAGVAAVIGPMALVMSGVATAVTVTSTAFTGLAGALGIGAAAEGGGVAAGLTEVGAAGVAGGAGIGAVATAALVAVPALALLGGALTAVYLESQKVGQTFDEAAHKGQNFAANLKILRDSSLQLKISHDNVAQATKAVTAAQEAYRAAVHDSGRDSAAAQAADERLWQARFNLALANNNEADTEKTRGKAYAAVESDIHRRIVATNDVFRTARETLTRLVAERGKDSDASKLMRQEIERLNQDLPKQVHLYEQAANQIRPYNAQLAANYDKTAQARQALLDYINAIHRFPNGEQLKLYIESHFTTSGDLSTTGRGRTLPKGTAGNTPKTDQTRQRAFGGPLTPGVEYRFNERGQESIRSMMPNLWVDDAPTTARRARRGGVVNIFNIRSNSRNPAMAARDIGRQLAHSGALA